MGSCNGIYIERHTEQYHQGTCISGHAGINPSNSVNNTYTCLWLVLKCFNCLEKFNFESLEKALLVNLETYWQTLGQTEGFQKY